MNFRARINQSISVYPTSSCFFLMEQMHNVKTLLEPSIWINLHLPWHFTTWKYSKILFEYNTTHIHHDPLGGNLHKNVSFPYQHLEQITYPENISGSEEKERKSNTYIKTPKNREVLFYSMDYVQILVGLKFKKKIIRIYK